MAERGGRGCRSDESLAAASPEVSTLLSGDDDGVLEGRRIELQLVQHQTLVEPPVTGHVLRDLGVARRTPQLTPKELSDGLSSPLLMIPRCVKEQVRGRQRRTPIKPSPGRKAETRRESRSVSAATRFGR